ncbi:AraC family transcriptional regulator [Paraburkholderia caballeronis]|uniref:AraC family transcriptional regulator n=1 Tax=Paraburkholderia caballeronis TaxID=416943 RepID=UPI00106558E3|nr:helix-turn-helix transcriptional regulator [Paraburkholderia caballeronis]TDV20861.1 AraC family transcriptional regulator [Paraburkholderia caballeronis]TDV21290.1 AraC family transcriptional regulator [Paraburkholderia caballeronis]TDV33329.1 AraC family transcriptional regulator [Paraburkholderia caballeronis]
MPSSPPPSQPTDLDFFTDIPPEFEPTPAHPIRVRSRPMPAGVRIAQHTHGWAQLAYASRGVLRMTTPGTTWMVPPSRAIWVPPRVTHEVSIVEDAFLRTLYVDESVVPPGLGECRVVEVSGLLREVIASLDEPALPATRERLLCVLALDEMTRSAPLPLAVPMPEEKRLRALCEALIADPGNHGSLEYWAAHVGASTRTIARLFRQELGVSFSQWRQQAILARAIPLLNQGRPMAIVAQELGYQSQSAFSAMFRRAFGQSPRAFIARGAGDIDDPSAEDDSDDGFARSLVSADEAATPRDGR